MSRARATPAAQRLARLGHELGFAYNLQREDLVLLVNEGGVLVFRAMLRDAAKDIGGEDGDKSLLAPSDADFDAALGRLAGKCVDLPGAVGLLEQLVE